MQTSTKKEALYSQWLYSRPKEYPRKNPLTESDIAKNKKNACFASEIPN